MLEQHNVHRLKHLVHPHFGERALGHHHHQLGQARRGAEQSPAAVGAGDPDTVDGDEIADRLAGDGVAVRLLEFKMLHHSVDRAVLLLVVAVRDMVGDDHVVLGNALFRSDIELSARDRASRVTPTLSAKVSSPVASTMPQPSPSKPKPISALYCRTASRIVCKFPCFRNWDCISGRLVENRGATSRRSTGAEITELRALRRGL